MFLGVLKKMVTNKWWNKTTEIVWDIKRHDTELLNSSTH